MIKDNKRERLINKRKERNKTQSDVAKAVGVTIQYYSMIELGDRTPRYEIMQRIADYYGVKPDYLFYDKSQRNEEFYE